MEILKEINNEFFKRIKNKISNDILDELKSLLNNFETTNREDIKKIIKKGRKIRNENKSN